MQRKPAKRKGKDMEDLADIQSASLNAQAQWLWNSFATQTGASQLEREGLDGGHPGQAILKIV